MLIQIDGLGSGRTLGSIAQFRVSARVALNLAVQIAKEAAWRLMALGFNQPLAVSPSALSAFSPWNFPLYRDRETVDRFISCAAYSQAFSAFQSLVNLLINLLAPTRSTRSSHAVSLIFQRRYKKWPL